MANSRINLISNGSATGSAATIQVPGDYVCIMSGTFGGTTIALQALAGDGSTWVSIPSASSGSATTFVVTLGAEMQVRASVTGGTPSALYVTLDYAGQ